MPLADNMQPILAKPAKQRSGFLKLHSSDNLFSWEQRIEFLKQFGTHSQHFTALQSGMQYFDVPGIGYQAYMQKWGRCMVLGDPVAEPLEHAAFLDEFLQKHGNASFIQVSEANASHLHARHAYYGTQFGKELKVPLSDWTVSGKSKKCIRKAINQAAEQGISHAKAKGTDEAFGRGRACTALQRQGHQGRRDQREASTSLHWLGRSAIVYSRGWRFLGGGLSGFLVGLGGLR